MSLESVRRDRLFDWHTACEAWGFEEIRPPFTAEGQALAQPGEIRFQAFRNVEIDGTSTRISLTVTETWADGPHEERISALERDGCHLQILSWNLQIGPGAVGQERLDVVPDPDDMHPRIHRHPFGEDNDARIEVGLPVPYAWLSSADEAAGGVMSASDGLKSWEPEDE